MNSPKAIKSAYTKRQQAKKVSKPVTKTNKGEQASRRATPYPREKVYVPDEPHEERDMPYDYKEFTLPGEASDEDERDYQAYLAQPDSSDEFEDDPKKSKDPYMPENEFEEVKDLPSKGPGGNKRAHSGQYVFKNSELFITWPQSKELTKDDVREHLLKLGFTHMVIGLEKHHQTIGQHIHAWAKRPKVTNMKIVGADKWTIKGIVAHISKLRGKNGLERQLRMQEYAMKDQDYICHPDKNSIVGAHFASSKNFRKVHGDMEAWARMRTNIAIGTADPYPFKLMNEIEVDGKWDHSFKRKNIWIVGPSNIGTPHSLLYVWEMYLT